ncbi:MAG: hypothetical protein FPO08_07715 [Geobacter sp.]|nr:MAG: hypothetical protein FPO08_07715 [Geobacter sp.]
MRILGGSAGTAAVLETANVVLMDDKLRKLPTLWMAVFADMGSSLLVIFNGLLGQSMCVWLSAKYLASNHRCV